MEREIIFLSGIVVSCLVTTMVIFQFIESRHNRKYQSDGLYLGIKLGVSLILMAVNIGQNPIANIASWILLFGLISLIFYKDEGGKGIWRILEAEVMVLVFAICEAIGVLLLSVISWWITIPKLPVEVESFLTMTFSMLVLVFLYYLVISRIWGRNQHIRFTRQQCILHVIIAGYSMVNMLLIIEVVSRLHGRTETILLLINMGFIIIADMYFLYFVQVIEETNQLKIKLKLLEQQSSMQYHYYELQEKKYFDSIRILHDVDKHIRGIERLYQMNHTAEAMEYTKEINKMLSPLIPQNLTSQPMLNILLADKRQEAEKLGIEVTYEIEHVDFGFMEPIDVTTVFGNILDNAIEASIKARQDRPDAKAFIVLKIHPYYEMIAIAVENSTIQALEWKDGRPVSRKDGQHGIGLKNVEQTIEKYDGTMQLTMEHGCFHCNIVLSS